MCLIPCSFKYDSSYGSRGVQCKHLALGPCRHSFSSRGLSIWPLMPHKQMSTASSDLDGSARDVNSDRANSTDCRLFRVVKLVSLVIELVSSLPADPFSVSNSMNRMSPSRSDNSETSFRSTPTIFSLLSRPVYARKESKLFKSNDWAICQYKKMQQFHQMSQKRDNNNNKTNTFFRRVKQLSEAETWIRFVPCGDWTRSICKWDKCEW